MTKSLLVLCLAATLCMQSTVAQYEPVTLSGGDVVAIFAGIMNGVIHKDNLQQLQLCMNGAQELSDNFQRAVANFKEGGITGYTEGIMEIANIVNELPYTVQNCQEISDDLSQLGEWASIFTQPTVLLKTVSYNLVWHFSEIHGHIQLALQSYDNQQYFMFGDHLGQALVIATKQE